MPDMSGKPKALSLFSGAGGMDIGIIQAGFEVVSCIEIDPYACETLEFNIKRENQNTKVIKSDIRLVSPEQLLLELGLRSGELDLLFGGPPCQTFSQIGKRNSLNDERGLLIFEMIRFAKHFRPRVILIEQVEGLLKARDELGRPGEVFKRLVKNLQ